MQSDDIRNPLISFVNRCFLMSCGIQIQKPPRASTAASELAFYAANDITGLLRNPMTFGIR